MALEFPCSNCGNQLYIRYLHIGEKALCKYCGKTVTIPEEAVHIKEPPPVEKAVDHTVQNVPWKETGYFKDIDAEIINPARTLTNAVKIAFLTIIPSLALLALAVLMKFSMLNRLLHGNIGNFMREAEKIDAITGLSITIYIILDLAATITFLAWFYRAHRNLALAGFPYLKHSSVWTIVGFFMPFLNFVFPFLMMRETWKGSLAISGALSEEQWYYSRTSQKIIWWWLLMIIALMGNITSSLMARFGTNMETVMASALISALAKILLIIAAILLILLIDEISRHQAMAQKIAEISSPFTD